LKNLKFDYKNYISLTRKYQAKYYATLQKTAKAFEARNYKQRFLVPSDQLGEVNKIRLSKGKISCNRPYRIQWSRIQTFKFRRIQKT